MRFWKTSKVAAKAALMGAGDAVDSTRKFAVRHENTIAKTAGRCVSATGNAIRVAGTVVSRTGKFAARAAYGKAAASSSRTTKLSATLAGVLCDAADLTGQAVHGLGALTGKSAPIIGGIAGGIPRGVAEIAAGAVDSVAITESDLSTMREELKQRGQWAEERSAARLASIENATQHRRRSELLDLLVIGGVTLAEIVRSPGSVPPDVEEAFRLQYPDLAAHETFAQAVQHMPSDALVGLVSGVKGKLFEMGLVDHLNHGGLAPGLHAELAQSATQPGWDISVADAHGNVVDAIQAKASESAQYVLAALRHYPDIDVTTTSEVYAQLLAHGMAANIHDGGVALATLDAKMQAVNDGIAHGIGVGTFLPSSIGLAVIGLSVFMDKTLSMEQGGAAFGNRGAKAGMAGAAAKAAMVATQTWWLALVVGVGSRWLSSHGHGKRERYEVLASSLEVMRRRQPMQNYVVHMPAQ